MSVFAPPDLSVHPFGRRPNVRVAAPTDPLDHTCFDEFFDARVAPELGALEAERVRQVGRFWRNSTIAALLALAGAVAIAPVLHGRLLAVPLMLGALYSGSLATRLNSLGARAKERLLSIIAGALKLDYQLSGFRPAAYDRLNDLKLLPKSDLQVFDDLFIGQRRGVDFAVCDACLQDRRGKTKVDVFRGQLIRFEFSKRFNGVTVIARDNGLLNAFRQPPGMRRVGLASSEFERAFEVYSTDQVEARFLVHPAFMQKLLDMEALYQGCNLRGVFCGGEFLLAIEGMDRFDVGSPFRPFDRKEEAQEVADDLAYLLQMIDFVLAGPPRAPELAQA
jgi:hypothetical protein